VRPERLAFANGLSSHVLQQSETLEAEHWGRGSNQDEALNSGVER